MTQKSEEMLMEGVEECFHVACGRVRSKNSVLEDWVMVEIDFCREKKILKENGIDVLIISGKVCGSVE